MGNIQFEVIESRSGLPVIQSKIEGKSLLLHSKYDPIKEAERFIESCKERIENADHILFYGAGMGYHIKVFFEKYPEKIASVYEPFEEVQKLSIQYKEQTKFPFYLLQNYVVRTREKLSTQDFNVFSKDLNKKIEIIPLPSYGEWQSEYFKEFIYTFQKFVEVRKVNTIATKSFARRWTINALINLPKTMEHPNFLVEKKGYFQDKPVIIVSAGPSLTEEIENLRYIKEKGLAYIFAVGSANKALIRENIYPDAICTYDPQRHNFTVFNELIQNQIDTIPMIYGTTVGFETIEYYEGPKLYFPVSQDSLTVQFHKDPQIVVSDATTIAIVTLQLLKQLEVRKIILVGQNFAFKKDKFYADGIARSNEKKGEELDNTATEEDLKETFEVEDVHGGKVLTNFEFQQMRMDMESYLEDINIPVINTTNGGAAIQGTIYKPLKTVIEEELTQNVVEEDWWKDTIENREVLDEAFFKKYKRGFEQFEQQQNELQGFLDDFKRQFPNLNDTQIQQQFKKFDSLFQKYIQNSFYKSTILPIAQLPFEQLKSENDLIVAMKNLKQKAAKVIEVYTIYIQECKKIYLDIAPIVSCITLTQLNKIASKKHYVSTSGVFHFEGEWSRRFPTEKEKMLENLTEEEQKEWYKEKELKDEIDIPLPIFVETKEKGAKVQFRFKGTECALFGWNFSNKTLDLKIQIDKNVKIVRLPGKQDENLDNYIRKSIYSLSNLKNKMHVVEIEVLSDNPHFLFDKVEINHTGRIYHLDEVVKVNELEVGKRIRCHYNGTFNTVGDFNNLGKETSDFLPIQPDREPNGDFYFIMVDEFDGKIKLIADRTIQNYISYTTLKNALFKNKSKKSLEDVGYITLPSMGRFKGDKDNDWYKYIESKKYPNEDLIWNFIKHRFNFGSDIPEENPNKGVFRGTFHNGKGISFGENAHDWFVLNDMVGAYSTYGFRPLLIGEKKI